MHPCSKVKQEQELIKKCVEWDRNAQYGLYEMFAKKMFVVCVRYSSSKEEAEDTLQEGFMKVFKNIGQFKNEGSFEGWLRKIMVNTALRKFHSFRYRPWVSLNENKHSQHHYYDEDILSRIGTKELIAKIQTLTPAYRRVFNLYIFEGLNHREISVRLGISVGTSKSHLSDARAILRRSINSSFKMALQNVEL